MKRSLASAFSTKAIAEQEYIVHQSLDQLIEKLESYNRASSSINLTEWYGMLAFDILGDMAFGESFGSIEQGAW